MGLTPSGLRKGDKGGYWLKKKERRTRPKVAGSGGKRTERRESEYSRMNRERMQKRMGKGKWEWKRRGRDGRGKERRQTETGMGNAAAMRPEIERPKQLD